MMSGEGGHDGERLSLYVNFPVSTAIRLAPADAEQAARVLTLAAELLRKRERLPHDLADYLADAFEAAMAKPPEHRVQHLALELHLRASNRRPTRVGWTDAYQVMQDNPGMSKAQLARAIVRKFSVSESTAKRLIDQARNAERESRRVNAENDEGA